MADSHSVAKADYSDSRFNRTRITSAMAVSGRQFQRKLNGLLELNPVDYLRDYCLKKYNAMHAEGKQIAIVANHCDFSSPYHYTCCYSEQYEIAPRQYQLRAATMC